MTQTVYGIVFVVVLLAVVGQGTFVPSIAGRLGIPMHDQALRPWQLSVGLSEKPHGVHEFSITADASRRRTNSSPTYNCNPATGSASSSVTAATSHPRPTRLAAGDQSSCSPTLPATKPPPGSFHHHR